LRASSARLAEGRNFPADTGSDFREGEYGTRTGHQIHVRPAAAVVTKRGSTSSSPGLSPGDQDRRQDDARLRTAAHTGAHHDLARLDHEPTRQTAEFEQTQGMPTFAIIPAGHRTVPHASAFAQHANVGIVLRVITTTIPKIPEDLGLPMVLKDVS